MIARALAAALLVLAAGCASVADTPLPVLRIGVIGDQTGAGTGLCASDRDLAAAYAALDAGVTRLNAESPDVVLHTGDLVESCRDEADVRGAFARATGILDRLRARWFLTPGDHDVNPRAFVPDSDDRSRDRLFTLLYERRRPEADRRLYYSANVKGYHIVALNSQERLHADPRWGAILLAAISDVQRQWLERDLQRHLDAPGIVVFLHQPLWLNWTGWAEIHRLLRRYATVTVIAGHLHYDQDDGEIDGIRYITVGATGGRLKNADARSGGRHQVAVVEVQGRRTDVPILDLEGGERRPNPRAQMDRVQMLDVMLGGLWGFGIENPVQLRDGRLIAACDTRDPARLAVAMLGNPLDVPLEVRVRPRGLTVGGTFDTKACGHDAGTCTLRPGARIAIANLSSVEVTSGLGPLWSAEVQGSAPVGASIELDVRLTFDAGDGERTVERRLGTTVLACP